MASTVAMLQQGGHGFDSRPRQGLFVWSLHVLPTSALAKMPPIRKVLWCLCELVIIFTLNGQQNLCLHLSRRIESDSPIPLGFILLSCHVVSHEGA